jgi:hypothetical protein
MAARKNNNQTIQPKRFYYTKTFGNFLYGMGGIRFSSLLEF